MLVYSVISIQKGRFGKRRVKPFRIFVAMLEDINQALAARSKELSL